MNADFEELVIRSRALASMDAAEVARLEALLAEMMCTLETKSARAFERQATLDRLASALSLSWLEVNSLARDIARGEDALRAMRSRATLELAPPMSMRFIEKIEGESHE